MEHWKVRQYAFILLGLKIFCSPAWAASISNNIQYDSVSRVLGWQFRFRWIVKPGNDIYVVWLNNWLDSTTGLTTLDRSAAAKVVYTYRF